MNRRMRWILGIGGAAIVTVILMPRTPIINAPADSGTASGTCKDTAARIRQDYLDKGFSQSKADDMGDSFLTMCLRSGKE